MQFSTEEKRRGKEEREDVRERARSCEREEKSGFEKEILAEELDKNERMRWEGRGNRRRERDHEKK